MKNKQQTVINTMRQSTITIEEKLYYLSPWFGVAEEVYPVYKGTYQVLDRATTNVYYALWNGKAWIYKDNSIDWVLNPKIVGQSEIKNPPWRGIIKQEEN